MTEAVGQMTRTAAVGALAIAFALGCSRQESPPKANPAETDRPAAQSLAPELDAVVGHAVDAAEKMSISELKPTLSEGDAVVIEAKVMGSMHPFVDGRAAMLVGDEAIIESCDLIPGDSCETPWDACCEPQADLQSATVLVQVVDADGKVLKHALKGVKGLKELSRVRVQGTVSLVQEGAVTINAEAIELL